jgi:hypothetical protein
MCSARAIVPRPLHAPLYDVVKGLGLGVIACISAFPWAGLLSDWFSWREGRCLPWRFSALLAWPSIALRTMKRPAVLFRRALEPLVLLPGASFAPPYVLGFSALCGCG